MHDDPTIRVNPEPTPETQQVGALFHVGLRPGVEVSKPASDDPQELQRHLPQYRVRELIGRGGMGNVMKVDDPKLARTVALKVMKLGPSATEDERGRFVREATVLAKLAHPNIVPIYDLGTDDTGSPFYTMKLVKGRTLQAIIKDIRDGVADAGAPRHQAGVGGGGESSVYHGLHGGGGKYRAFSVLQAQSLLRLTLADVPETLRFHDAPDPD